MRQNAQASNQPSRGEVVFAGAAIVRAMRDLADAGIAEDAIALAALNAAIDVLAGGPGPVPEPLLHRLVAFRLQQHPQARGH